MQAKTEELLYYLLWFSDKLMSPTFRNLTDSFEMWAYRNGLLQRLRRLEAQQLVERMRGPATKRIYRLSRKGRLHALGGRDPLASWDTSWDGGWRFVVFDIPEADSAARVALRRALRGESFGMLQKSVWITPRPLPPTIIKLCGEGDDLGAITTLEGEPIAGESDGDIVSHAWNFKDIDRRYRSLIRVLGKFPERRTRGDAARLRSWAAREREAWMAAVSNDPLLPSALLPRGYLGKKAWEKRKRVFAQARTRAEAIHIDPVQES